MDEDRPLAAAAAEVELSGTLFDTVMIVEAVMAGDVNGVVSFSTKWTCCISLELERIELVVVYTVSRCKPCYLFKGLKALNISMIS